MLNKQDLDAKAQELREKLGEDANSPVDIFSIVKQIDGLTLVFYPLGENISGMCVKDCEIKLIAINSTMSYGRQRFSLAHELYHLYSDDESGFNVCSKELNPKSENEKCADQFASYFLAPYKSLRSAVKKIAGDGPLSVQHVIALEQYFGMSRLAMFWRLVSEGWLDPDPSAAVHPPASNNDRMFFFAIRQVSVCTACRHIRVVLPISSHPIYIHPSPRGRATLQRPVSRTSPSGSSRSIVPKR